MAECMCASLCVFFSIDILNQLKSATHFPIMDYNEFNHYDNIRAVHSKQCILIESVCSTSTLNLSATKAYLTFICRFLSFSSLFFLFFESLFSNIKPSGITENWKDYGCIIIMERIETLVISLNDKSNSICQEVPCPRNIVVKHNWL